MRDHFGLAVKASAETAQALESADEEAISLAAEKRAGIYSSDFPFQAGERKSGLCWAARMFKPSARRDTHAA